jgi:YlmC/YmxH family sporulation protein
MIKISDLRQREVINILDGKRLGNIKDVELDLEEGRIVSIVIPGPSRFLRFFSFGKENDYIIPWEDIKKIGIDVILIEVNSVSSNLTTKRAAT